MSPEDFFDGVDSLAKFYEELRRLTAREIFRQLTELEEAYGELWAVARDAVDFLEQHHYDYRAWELDKALGEFDRGFSGFCNLLVGELA